jgi:hypothetical protein
MVIVSDPVFMGEVSSILTKDIYMAVIYIYIYFVSSLTIRSHLLTSVVYI